MVGAEAPVNAWRRHLLGTAKASAFMVNQAIAAVTVLSERRRPAPDSSQTGPGRRPFVSMERRTIGKVVLVP